MLTTGAPAPDREQARRRWLTLAALGLAQLLVVIDMTVVTIALPSAQRDLGMSDTARQWTITAYTVAFGGLLLLGGRLADRLGRRTTLLVGMAGFALASAAGGAAGSTELLIAARAGQGVFAALLAPSTMSLLTLTFTEPRERARAFGVFGAIMMSGAALGLVAGGALAEYLDWRWCLYINLPIAAIAFVTAWVLVPGVSGHRETRLDWASAVLGGGGIVALVYGLAEAGEYGWGSASVLGPLVLAVVLLVAFTFRQRRAAHPLLPLGVVAHRSRAAAFLTVGLAAFGMFGMFLFLTFQFQAIMGYGPLVAGLAFLPLVGANILVATQLSGRLLPRTGPRPLLAGGLLLLAIGLLLLTRLTPDSSYLGLVLPAEVALGCGAGLAMPTVLNTATSGVAASETGAASAFITTSQQVGASLGTATLNAIAAAATGAVTGSGSPAAATVHGYAVASGWGAAVLVAAALGVALLAGRTRGN
ncbi:DHA2 family efflux MFS transporter permease subunit [Amycolatopsis cihanbeyliensis]|uniref:DHA2 family efflux MFS transporter permease subunit n=1 Tax=Amycolatopsis cihanbeyliensis TaxID=1128664 RepID=UPI001FED1165|nr:DHA2 family efflux MFS transporter permease subunit [Amycolatopsis cihanbeyliensis]